MPLVVTFVKGIEARPSILRARGVNTRFVARALGVVTPVRIHGALVARLWIMSPSLNAHCVLTATRRRAWDLALAEQPLIVMEMSSCAVDASLLMVGRPCAELLYDKNMIMKL